MQNSGYLLTRSVLVDIRYVLSSSTFTSIYMMQLQARVLRARELIATAESRAVTARTDADAAAAEVTALHGQVAALEQV
jgi:hypothetical protein